MTWSFDNRCDRILWYGKGVKQISYFRSESKFSDHRPVSALFTTKIEVVKCANRRAVAPEPVVPSGGNPTKIVSHSASFISHSKNIYFLKLELAYQKYQISSKINTIFIYLFIFTMIGTGQSRLSLIVEGAEAFPKKQTYKANRWQMMHS